MKKKRLATVSLEDIVVDPDFQSRADGLDEDQLEQLVEFLKKKSGSIPRIKIVDVKGTGLILVDGFSRVTASRRAFLTTIQAEIEDGSLLTATIAAAQANMEQLARRRTNADKRRAVELILRRLHEAKEDWSDRKISATVGVSPTLVGEIRSQIPLSIVDSGKIETKDETEEKPSDVLKPKRQGLDGREYKQPKKPVEAWEEIDVSEFLDVADYVLEAIGAMKAGDLDRRIAAGELFGLTKIDIRDLQRQLEKVKTGSRKAEPEPPKPKPKKSGEEKGFNWREFNSHFGHMTRGVDDLYATGKVDRQEHKGMMDDLTAFRRKVDAIEKREGK